MRAVATVAPELRVPAIYVPFPIRPAALGLAQRMQPPGRIKPMPAGVNARRVTIPADGPHPAVDVSVYSPATPSGDALLWIHGGGFVTGSTADCDDWCGRVAHDLGAVVVSVDYRLAPTHPFPAGFDDCWHALAWLREHAGELGTDPARIIVGGESAGGGLAATLAQRAVDAGWPLLFQLLVYPMLDDRTVQRAERHGEWNVVWDPACNRVGWTAYLGHEPDERRTPAPYAVAARRVHVTGLAPAWIGVGDQDLFATEDARYAQRLREAGVACELEIIPGMYHAADRFAPHAAAMVAFRHSMLEALRRAYAR